MMDGWYVGAKSQVREERKLGRALFVFANSPVYMEGGWGCLEICKRVIQSGRLDFAPSSLLSRGLSIARVA